MINNHIISLTEKLDNCSKYCYILHNKSCTNKNSCLEDCLKLSLNDIKQRAGFLYQQKRKSVENVDDIVINILKNLQMRMVPHNNTNYAYFKELVKIVSDIKSRASSPRKYLCAQSDIF